MSERTDHQIILYDHLVTQTRDEEALQPRTQQMITNLAADLGRQIASSEVIKDTELMRTMVVLEHTETQLSGQQTDDPYYNRKPLHELEGEQAVDPRSFTLGAIYAMQCMYIGFRGHKITEDEKQKRAAKLAPFRSAVLERLAEADATPGDLGAILDALVKEHKMDEYDAYETPALHHTILQLIGEQKVQQVINPETSTITYTLTQTPDQSSAQQTKDH